jgi:acetyl esterase/lipase
MHGDKNSAVSFSQNVRRAEALKSAGVEVPLQPVNGAGHRGQEFHRTRKFGHLIQNNHFMIK